MLPEPNEPAEVYDPEDIEKNKLIAGLAYVLCFLPLLFCPDSRYGRFHANQGIVLLLLSIIAWAFLGAIPTAQIVIPFIIPFFVIIGAFNALTGKAKDLPIIGGFRVLK